jgi:hypothetical protein
MNNSIIAKIKPVVRNNKDIKDIRKHVGISIGRDCLPAMWGVHTKYRSTKAKGYKSCPFDLMVSNYQGVVKCILDDFRYFTDLSFLTYDGNGVIRNTYYNFDFNHETPGHANLYKIQKWPGGTNHFIHNNFAHFIARYNDRIRNFRNYLSADNTFINFILRPSNPSEYADDCKELRAALAAKYPSLSYNIIIIESQHVQHNPAQTQIVKIIEPSSLVIL